MDNIFLATSLFVPRLSLIWYYANGWIPLNPIPLFADFFITLLLPRLLVLIYIYGNQGMSAWFWVHLTVFIISIVMRMQTEEK